MSNCRFYKTVHAYIDGELGETERKELEAHLNTCPECMSALREYRMVSSVLSDCTPPPDALRTGVMARVMESDFYDTPVRKRKTLTALQRTLAAAACFALVVLAAVHLIQNGRFLQKNDSAPAMEQYSAAFDKSPGSAGYETGGGSADMDTASTENSVSQQFELDGGAAYEPAPMPEAAPEPEVNGNITTQIVPPSGTDGEIHDDIISEEREQAGSADMLTGSGAFYGHDGMVFRISGKLPEVLEDYEQIESDGVVLIYITAETAQKLIDAGYGAVQNDEHGEKALVVFVP